MKTTFRNVSLLAAAVIVVTGLQAANAEPPNPPVEADQAKPQTEAMKNPMRGIKDKLFESSKDKKSEAALKETTPKEVLETPQPQDPAIQTPPGIESPGEIPQP